MQITADDRSAFAPPPQPGPLRAAVLAVIAHLLLVAALTSGLQWKREATEMSAEAELWSALPQQAAPKEVQAPPTPPAPAAPPAPPVVRAPPVPDPQVQRDAQIALEREQDRREQARREEAQREQARREEARREEAQRETAERRRAERERKAQADRKLAAERKREEEANQREQVKLAAEAKRKDDAQKKRREEQEAERVSKMREDNLRRMQGLAGGTGAPSSSGTAATAAGPSANWAGRVRGRVRPNIVFSDDVAGNPTAEVEVRMAPDGTIVGKRLVKASGNRSWDEAVLRALDKTEILPRDTDGRVHSPVVITFRPKD